MKKSELENNEDYVECKDCGHIVAKGRAQEIELNNRNGKTILTYCEHDKKPYDSVIVDFNYLPHYLKKMEVSEDGTPIGYKKITPKK